MIEEYSRNNSNGLKIMNLINQLEYLAELYAGQEIKNQDGTYTQVSRILWEAAEELKVSYERRCKIKGFV